MFHVLLEKLCVVSMCVCLCEVMSYDHAEQCEIKIKV